MGNNMKAKKRVSLYKKQSVTGWAFLLPATLLIFAMNFYPMLQAFILSFKTGIGNNQTWSGLSNYARLLKDGVFRTAITNNFFYLIIQVPVMLILAIFLACLLNKKDLRGKGIYRTMIFLPCCTALVSYSIIWLYQHGFTEIRADRRAHQLAWRCPYSKSDHYSCTDLAMDGIQYGILFSRSAEYR